MQKVSFLLYAHSPPLLDSHAFHIYCSNEPSVTVAIYCIHIYTKSAATAQVLIRLTHRLLPARKISLIRSVFAAAWALFTKLSAHHLLSVNILLAALVLHIASGRIYVSVHTRIHTYTQGARRFVNAQFNICQANKKRVEMFQVRVVDFKISYAHAKCRLIQIVN